MKAPLTAALASALLVAASPARAEEPGWCAPELETLPGDVCHHAGKPHKSGRRTLVIFLHGLVQQDSGWQINQQRGFAHFADRFGFSVLMPRGRNGAMRSGKQDTIAWPTSREAQERFEEEVIAEWQAARALLESRDRPFDEVFVMGFSNGAYYAASLALRGRLDVDGYAVFAGGSGASSPNADKERRRPVFVAIATKDRTTIKDGRELARRLRKLGWPHRAEERRVGHTVADTHLEHALTYLRKSVRRTSD